MRVALRVLGYLWALPNTVIGLLLGLLAFTAPRRIGGVLAFDGRERGFAWIVGRFGRSAITFGHVLIARVRLEGRLLAHERRHVTQYEVLGPIYLPAYLLIFPFTGYRRHPFEADARRAAAAETAG